MCPRPRRAIRMACKLPLPAGRIDIAHAQPSCSLQVTIKVRTETARRWRAHSVWIADSPHFRFQAKLSAHRIISQCGTETRDVRPITSRRYLALLLFQP
jgi:hypothetical protein